MPSTRVLERMREKVMVRQLRENRLSDQAKAIARALPKDLVEKVYSTAVAEGKAELDRCDAIELELARVESDLAVARAEFRLACVAPPPGERVVGNLLYGHREVTGDSRGYAVVDDPKPPRVTPAALTVKHKKIDPLCRYRARLEKELTARRIQAANMKKLAELANNGGAPGLIGFLAQHLNAQFAFAGPFVIKAEKVQMSSPSDAAGNKLPPEADPKLPGGYGARRGPSENELASEANVL